jgi:hypothetical protein
MVGGFLLYEIYSFSRHNSCRARNLSCAQPAKDHKESNLSAYLCSLRSFAAKILPGKQNFSGRQDGFPAQAAPVIPLNPSKSNPKK